MKGALGWGAKTGSFRNRQQHPGRTGKRNAMKAIAYLFPATLMNLMIGLYDGKAIDRRSRLFCYTAGMLFYFI